MRSKNGQMVLSRKPLGNAEIDLVPGGMA